tara:strand:+ start:20744 stop:22357 length:1614 start_codon:yes stop_codon:yes gene_type:complete
MYKITSNLNKRNVFLIISLIILPILLHINETNLRQYSSIEITYLFIFQLTICFGISLITIFLCLFFKKIKFQEFFICNLLIYFLQFFFIDILDSFFFKKINELYTKLDFILLLLVYLIIYIISLIQINKNNKKINSFLIIFLSLNLILSGFNILKYYSILTTDHILEKKNEIEIISSNSIDIKKIKPIQKDKLIDVYFIIPDAMISLERAEQLNIINTKQEIIKKLENQNFNYNSKFFSNYPYTFLSINAALIGDYPLNENSKKFFNRKNFFPRMMNNPDNQFYKILNKMKFNFYYIGNRWGSCPVTLGKACLYNYSSKNKLFEIKYFLNYMKVLKNSLVTKFVTILRSNNILKENILVTNFINAYEFIQKRNYLKEESKKNSNFFLIHILKPHVPYNLDKNCNLINEIDAKNINQKIRYYSYNYNCVLNSLLNWENDLSLINSDREKIIFIFGDHGWFFGNEKSDDVQKINDVFYAHKTPERCKSIKKPNSQVNIMRYLLNCLNSLNINYIDDEQYLQYDKNHANVGRVYKLKNND